MKVGKVRRVGFDPERIGGAWQTFLCLNCAGSPRSFRASRRSTTCRSKSAPARCTCCVGENGAGKSTLMKVLCGAYRADRGEFFSNGERRCDSRSPARRAAARHRRDLPGVLAGPVSRHRAEHLSRPRIAEPAARADRPPAHAREAQRVLDLLGIDLDTRTLAHRLGVAQQQIVEIAKALSQDARILVMDEPTAALSEREIERLFAVIARLKARASRSSISRIGCRGVRARRPHHRAARRPQGRRRCRRPRPRRTSSCT